MESNYNKIKDIIIDVIRDNENSVTYDSNGNIRLRSNSNGLIIDITGGPEFTKDFHEAMKEEMNKPFNYGLHPVTGKPMTEDEFYSIAKKHNWTNEQIFNNLYNSK